MESNIVLKQTKEEDHCKLRQKCPQSHPYSPEGLDFRYKQKKFPVLFVNKHHLPVPSFYQ